MEFVGPKQNNKKTHLLKKKNWFSCRMGGSRSPLCWWQAPCSQCWLPPYLSLLVITAHSRLHHFAPKIYLRLFEPIPQQVKNLQNMPNNPEITFLIPTPKFQRAEATVSASTQQRYRHPHRTARRCQLHPLQWANDVLGQFDLRARWSLPCSLI